MISSEQQADRSEGQARRGRKSAVQNRSDDDQRTSYRYDIGELLGKGSFGVVCEARCLDTGEQVAIKRVLQDPRFKNRELDIMKMLSHPNIVTFRDFFYTEENGNKDKFLNVVMEHIPETVYRVLKQFVRSNQSVPNFVIKLYLYQMCRAIGYLHSVGVCHRDIKPQNLLVDTRTHVLKLCDFGSAKKLVAAEASVAYICSRYYRAPELMLGSTQYTNAIDVWSIGCVLGELLLGKPLFAGETSVDQLVKIIKILGTPTPSQMRAMNPECIDFKFPEVMPRDWKKVFDPSVDPEAIAILSRFLKYEPAERLKPFEALALPYFDELRDENSRLPSGARLPELFAFTDLELSSMLPETKAIVTPEWYTKKLNGNAV